MKHIFLSVVLTISVILLITCTEEDSEPVPANSLSANFSLSDSIIAPGMSVTFNDLSTGDPTSHEWVFEGGSPGSSTASNPTITYDSFGRFDVTLSVEKDDMADMKMKTEQIKVLCYLDSMEYFAHETQRFVLDNQSRLIRYDLFKNVWTFEYDEDNRPVSAEYSSQEGVTYTTFTYEYQNDLVSKTTLTTNTGAVTIGNHEYDANDQLVRSTFDNGYVRTYVYDEMGNMIQVEEVDNNNEVTFDRTYEFDDKINPLYFYNLPRTYFQPLFGNPNNPVKEVGRAYYAEYEYQYNELGLPESGILRDVPGIGVSPRRFEFTYYYNCS